MRSGQEPSIGNYILATATAVSGVLLIGFQNYYLGWPLLALTACAALIWRMASIRYHALLVAFSIGLLGLTPINTDVEVLHILQMGTLLILTVAIPYLISTYILRDRSMGFPLYTGKPWPTSLTLYIVITASLAYLLLPYYLISTSSYLNWSVDPSAGALALLFVGTNGLGIWDELFFVATMLALFRRHIAFWYANFAQAAVWTAFLYELGFRGWGPWVLFPFALSQGWIFRKTKSLVYILAIHLTLDFMLYLALIHAHHPDWLPIFLLSPHS